MKVQEKSTFSRAQLDDLRERLQDKHDRIQQELTRLNEQELPGLHKGEEANDGYGDDAKTDQIRQRIIEQIKRRRNDLAEINAALVRMDDGTYGFDERTGKPIRIERLKALPTARTAI
jgi:RNA polymerase-binding transcription factor DksA